MDMDSILKSLKDAGIDPETVRVRSFALGGAGDSAATPGSAPKMRVSPAVKADGRPVTLLDCLNMVNEGRTPEENGYVDGPYGQTRH
jgi:hypothetical protein